MRQSAALNRLGAENMKPRQLSDAIYQEVGYVCKSDLENMVIQMCLFEPLFFLGCVCVCFGFVGVLREIVFFPSRLSICHRIN